MIRLRRLTVVAMTICGAMSAMAADKAADVVLSPGANAQEEVQTALILAEPGQVIEFTEGVFEFTMGLSLDVDRVTLRGQGMDKTILSFKNQDAGSEGLLVTSDGVVLKDFAVEDTIGDAIKTKGCEGISFINVRAEWTGGPKSTNGAYGLYPVESSNVLIDGCVAIGASDAGIYVGQSRNIIVRNSRAEFNVAGIEIENSYEADVYDNVATRNTGGILVFDLPDLPQQGGRDVRVFRNQIVNNDTPNFAPPGNIVGNVPRGTGLMIMANTNVEVFENVIKDNDTANTMIISYLATTNTIRDPNYNPYPSAIHIYNNEFGGGGKAPDNRMGNTIETVAGIPVPDIVWDGMMNPEWVEDGKLTADRGIYIHSNGDATFINLNLPASLGGAEPLRDLSAHAGKLPSLKPVKIAGIK